MVTKKCKFYIYQKSNKQPYRIILKMKNFILAFLFFTLIPNLTLKAEIVIDTNDLIITAIDSLHLLQL